MKNKLALIGAWARSRDPFLRRRSRQRERIYASQMSICSLSLSSKTKTRFSPKLSNSEL